MRRIADVRGGTSYTDADAPVLEEVYYGVAAVNVAAPEGPLSDLTCIIPPLPGGCPDLPV